MYIFEHKREGTFFATFTSKITDYKIRKADNISFSTATGRSVDTEIAL